MKEINFRLFKSTDKWHKFGTIVLTTCIWWWIFMLKHSTSSVDFHFTRNYELMICHLTFEMCIMILYDHKQSTFLHKYGNKHMWHKLLSSHGICHLICISFSSQYHYHVQFEVATKHCLIIIIDYSKFGSYPYSIKI